MKWFYAVVCFLLLPAFVLAQSPMQPKLVKAKGDYSFPKGVYVFPKKLFDRYDRRDIIAYEKANISASYVEYQGGRQTIATIYAYPAAPAAENRLRTNFVEILTAIAPVAEAVDDIEAFPLTATDGQYTCNGYAALFNTLNGAISELVFFECGEWYYKIRITTELLDRAGVDSLTAQILSAYNPAALTANKPLGRHATLELASGLQADIALSVCVLADIMARSSWAMENISEGERASGVPDIYVEMYEAGFKAFASVARERDPATDDKTRRYIEEVCEIVDSGFLREFLIEQLYTIVKLPEGFIPDDEGYEKWKAGREFAVDLDRRFSQILYGGKKKK